MISTQRPDGLFTNLPMERVLKSYGVSHAAMYNHGICGLMLGEVYGVAPPKDDDRIRSAITRGVAYSLSRQIAGPNRPKEKGGYDYYLPSRRSTSGPRGDLPITAWQLMLLRSAENAGFDVPVEPIDEAMEYIRNCFDHRDGIFLYRHEHSYSRGCTAAGVVSLSLGGEHNTAIARQAGDWLLTQSFEPFNRLLRGGGHDRCFYSAFYCSQAMFQLGGKYWKTFYPQLLEVLTTNQKPNGSWESERTSDTARYGSCYSTSLSVLALTPPYRILPIYQR